MRLIDADALKIDYGFTWDDITPTHEEMYALIDRQPTIDAVPVRHAKWINRRNDDGHNIADCSRCGSAIQWFDDDEKPRYCCMCGARMDERKES